jgi:hypothetical protein
MNLKSLLTAATALVLASGGAWLIWGSQDRHEPEIPSSPAGAATPEEAAAALSDASVAPHQSELLEVAFGAASAFPSNPHIKNKSRAQEAVVATCLELGLARRAASWASMMETWRQGAVCADLAHWCASHGHPGLAAGYIGRANEIAEAAARNEGAQDWHRDRIRSRVARALIALGRTDEAAGVAQGVVASEAGPLETAMARTLDGARFGEQIAAVDSVIAEGNFEPVRNALEVCVVLFDRFYDDASRREAAEARVLTGYAQLPPQVRADLMMKLAESALAHDDAAKARELVTAVRELLDPVQETSEARIPRLARLAALRHRAGEEREAHSDLGAVLAMYEVGRESIVDVYRAGILLPIAEGYHAAGDRESARGVYRRALEESVINPNSRPRADDLVAICCSMASRGVAPDAALTARIRQVRDSLGPPW